MKHITITLLLAIFLIPPIAYGAPITIFSADGSSPSSPWDTLENIAPNDIQQGVTAGSVFSLFPSVDGPNAQADFLASGIDPNTVGSIIKLGGFSDSGTAGTASPLTLSASRVFNPLNLTMNINFTIDTPAFEDVIYWFDNISVMLDPDENNDGVPDENVMVWIEWKLASKYVAKSRGVKNWVKQANALLKGNTKVNIRQIKKYEKQGKIKREWFLEPEIVAHPIIPANELQGATLDIDLSLVDTEIPEPGPLSLVALGLLLLANMVFKRTT